MAQPYRKEVCHPACYETGTFTAPVGQVCMQHVRLDFLVAVSSALEFAVQICRLSPLLWVAPGCPPVHREALGALVCAGHGPLMTDGLMK